MSHKAALISHQVQEIPEALSVYFNQLVYELRRKQRDIVTLSLGEAFFDIPNFGFEQIDFSRGYHYSHSRGIPELRECIARYYRNQYSASITANDVLISAGSKIIIYMCMQAILNPGDEVLIHEPGWLSYQEQARLVGATVHFIPYDVPSHHFCDFFSRNTRILILNNPNNPAGKVYQKEDLLLLYQHCQRHNIYLLVDEAYSDFVLDDSFYSMAELVPDLKGVLVVNSLSKNMGMSGWRIGYVITEDRLLSALLKLNQHLITCAPTILQEYIATHFDKILSHTLPQVREVVAKRQRIVNHLDEIGLTYLPGAATFYFFLKTAPYLGDIYELALYLLLEKNICVVPGSAYGKTTSKFLRLSIGAESEERIDQALLVLRDLLSGPVLDGEYIHAELARLGLPEFSGGLRKNKPMPMMTIP